MGGTGRHAAPGRPARGNRRPARFRVPSRPDVIGRLDAAGLLPAITFIFSRAGCDAAVLQCLDAGLRLATPDEAAEITAVAERRTADIPDEDLQILGFADWLAGLRRGIAAHHAGMLPTFKEVVEELFAAGLIRAVFATETLALGINMPARTVVIERLDKWNGENHADLTPGEYTQLTGRAGCAASTSRGTRSCSGSPAWIRWQWRAWPAPGPTRSAPASGRPTTWRSTWSAASAGGAPPRCSSRRSRSSRRTGRWSAWPARRARSGSRWRKSRFPATAATSPATWPSGGSCPSARGSRPGPRSAARQAEAVASLGQLRRGDIIQVPGGRRAGIALVLESPAADLPAPLVLTVNRQVKRLSLADFPVPVDAHRPGADTELVQPAIGEPPQGPGLDHAQQAGRPRSGQAAAGRGRQSSTGEGGPGEGGLAGGIKPRSRACAGGCAQHPCHACPDREEHARQAEQYLRLEREAEALERKVGGRTHVIARTFDRVCAVLDQLGYTDGDTVTEEGRRLAGLYTELDLLVAECLRRGLWDDLAPAELAACVSALTFESRRPDDSSPPRLPHGRSREVLAEMVRVWGELDGVEKEHHLSFLREPDLGFAWTAHVWARGRPLEQVLSADLTPGDFVRAVKQLIDLLDQVAAAARAAPVADTARRAIAALRRGVVAYSSVG